ncbi:MAG TPA: hypothetical protein VHG91_07180 [Longimicrobium sp.]|nr:hypothetical protein [Longimicrobium sp.]
MLTAAAAVSLTLALPAIAQRDTDDDFPLRIDRVEIVGLDAALGTILSARVGPDGQVYVTDHQSAQIVAFDPDGRLLWRSGRKGRGPGEFEMPYRVAVSADRGVLVLDRATSEVSALGPDGRFRQRYTLPVLFGQVDHMVATPAGELLISGVTVARSDPRSARYGIHRFSLRGQEMKWLGSFGPLPPVQDRQVLEHWGAGTLTPASGGDVLFSVRFPYAIHRFDASGRAKSVIRPSRPLQGKPEDAIIIEKVGASTIFSTGTREVLRPGPAWELPGGWTLATRLSDRRLLWDLVSPAGTVSTRSLPENWKTVVGYDAARSLLWVTATENDEPVLLKVSVTLAGAK